MKTRFAAFRAARGTFSGAAILVFCLPLLSGCLAPMSLGEAQDYAGRRLERYCGTRCGAYHLAGSQRLKSRWLLDYDTPAHKLTVVVEDDGNTKVTVWDKPR